MNKKEKEKDSDEVPEHSHIEHGSPAEKLAWEKMKKEDRDVLENIRKINPKLS